MEIYALEGYKVQVTDKTKNNGYNSDSEKVTKLLELNTPYTVHCTEVSGSSTLVFLKEFEGQVFNSVSFEGITNQPTELNRNHPDWSKYNN